MSQLRKIRYRLFSWMHFGELMPSQEEIDVVLPIIPKDLSILPLCLQGIRRCVAHKIKNIYVVAPCNDAIQAFCEKEQLVFVDEASLFGFAPRDLQLITTFGANRSGWLFQQLVKLSGLVGTCRYYLCIDADHVLTRPHVFLTDKGETVFYMSYEEHQPYYDFIKRMLPELELSTLSYVDHKMLFDKQLLAALQQRLSQADGGKDWKQVILDNIDRTQLSGFSEFETYGNFCRSKVLRPWRQKRLDYARLAGYEALCKKYPARWSLTFPEYREQKS